MFKGRLLFALKKETKCFLTFLGITCFFTCQWPFISQNNRCIYLVLCWIKVKIALSWIWQDGPTFACTKMLQTQCLGFLWNALGRPLPLHSVPWVSFSQPLARFVTAEHRKEGGIPLSVYWLSPGVQQSCLQHVWIHVWIKTLPFSKGKLMLLTAKHSIFPVQKLAHTGHPDYRWLRQWKNYYFHQWIARLFFLSIHARLSFFALILKSVFLYVTWHCATIKLSLQGNVMWWRGNEPKKDIRCPLTDILARSDVGICSPKLGKMPIGNVKIRTTQIP